MRDEIVNKRCLAGVVLAFWVMTSSSHAQYLATSAEHTLVFGVEADPDDSVRLDVQHVDVNVSYFGGRGAVRIFADDFSDLDNPVTGVPYATDEAHLYSNADDKIMLTQFDIDNGFDFLGAGDGDAFWYIAEGFTGDSIFLGVSLDFDFNNELLEWNPGDAARGADDLRKYIRLELVSVNAPTGGHFSMFDVNATGPTNYMATSDGIDSNDVYYLLAGGHDHPNWAFTEPGIYEVTIRMTTMVPESYANWAWNNGIGDTNGTFNDQSPSGLSYGVLYALGLNPTLSTAALWPYADLFNDKPAYYLRLPENAPSDITYDIWKTTDLANASWAMQASKAGGAAWVTEADASVGGAETISTSDGRTLFRLVETNALGSGEQTVYQLRVRQ